MSILRFLVILPNPNGALSECVSPRIIDECNRRVSEVLCVSPSASPSADSPTSGKKRGKYATYSPSDRAKIGKCGVENGPSAAIPKLKIEFPNLKETTVRDICDSYKREFNNRKRKLDYNEPENIEINDIQPKKRGRKTLLPDEMDRQVQSYIEILRSSGGVVTTSICLAVGLGIVTAVDKQLLSSNGGPLKLTKHWAYSLLRRMKMVKHKGSCTAKTHISDSDFEKIKDGFLLKIKKAVAEHDIPADLVYNWDHTGLNYVSVSNWTMEVSGS